MLKTINKPYINENKNIWKLIRAKNVECLSMLNVENVMLL